MYCKLFTSLYQGTLRGKSDEILVFTNLLAHCDKDGFVDKHWRAISEEVGISEDRVKAAILLLEGPDEDSRSPAHNGRRLLRVDEHRAWGWQVTNYVKYRAIRNEDDRREQNRIAQEKWRKSKRDNKQNKQNKPPSAHAEAYADSEAYAKKTVVASAKAAHPQQTDVEWMTELQDSLAYRTLNVAVEYSKMNEWCRQHGKSPTRRRFINWLNRAEKPMNAVPKPNLPTGARAPVPDGEPLFKEKM